MKYLIFSLCLLFASPALSSYEKCRTLYWKSGRAYIINATLLKGVHIEFPETIMKTLYLGNEDLWDTGVLGNHLTVKHNSEEEEGKETS